MDPARIEHRLLELTLSPVGGDRFTLALLHWDGETLRGALRTRLPPSLGDARLAAKRVMRDAERALVQPRKAFVGLGLEDVLLVPAGDGAGLSWTPVGIGYTRNPEAHFQELASALRLTPFVRNESHVRPAGRGGVGAKWRRDG